MPAISQCYTSNKIQSNHQLGSRQCWISWVHEEQLGLSCLYLPNIIRDKTQKNLPKTVLSVAAPGCWQMEGVWQYRGRDRTRTGH